MNVKFKHFCVLFERDFKIDSSFMLAPLKLYLNKKLHINIIEIAQNLSERGKRNFIFLHIDIKFKDIRKMTKNTFICKQFWQKEAKYVKEYRN